MHAAIFQFASALVSLSLSLSLSLIFNWVELKMFVCNNNLCCTDTETLHMLDDLSFLENRYGLALMMHCYDISLVELFLMFYFREDHICFWHNQSYLSLCHYMNASDMVMHVHLVGAWFCVLCSTLMWIPFRVSLATWWTGIKLFLQIFDVWTSIGFL